MIVLGLLPFISGWIIARRLLPDLGRSGALPLALVFGLGLGSFEVCVSYLLLNGPHRGATIALGILALLGTLLIPRAAGNGSLATSATLGKSGPSTVVAMLFAFWMAGTGVAEALSWHVDEPHGQYDAIAIWSARARDLHRAGPNWRDAFEPAHFHADYPLLLPTNVVRSWMWSGRETNHVPFMLGVLTMLGSAALVRCALTRTHGSTIGWIGFGLVFAHPAYACQAGWHYADVPLSLFIVASCATWIASSGTTGERLATGLCVGLAAWTKNEGQAFAVAFVLALLIATISRRSTWRELKAVAIGLAIPGAMVLGFKMMVPLENDLVAAVDGSTWSRLTNVNRYAQVFRYSCDALIVSQPWYTWAMMLGLVVAFGLRRPSRSMLVPALAISGTVGAYFLVYVQTPYNLTWHLQSSFDRLLTQLVPSLVLLGTMCLSKPGVAGSLE